jgi:hypothetical protein
MVAQAGAPMFHVKHSVTCSGPEHREHDGEKSVGFSTAIEKGGKSIVE